jgi:hypothetical protein
MPKARILALSLLAAALAGRVDAADNCSARGKMQDQSFRLDACAIAWYPGQNSVAIWFTEKPLPASTLDTFHRGSYADLKGTAMSFAFCPGGGKAKADPKAVKDVEAAVRHADNPMLQQNWLFKPGDKGIRIEKLSGELKPGGRLAGRITVKTTLDQGQAYSWEADFDVALPSQTAAAGLSCGVD